MLKPIQAANIIMKTTNIGNYAFAPYDPATLPRMTFNMNLMIA